ncbi:hypothetical protein I4U23_005791 [Adineta vaga]|nr:hypothetical protein I4U23_005791 [Adineta vaga]
MAHLPRLFAVSCEVNENVNWSPSMVYIYGIGNKLPNDISSYCKFDGITRYEYEKSVDEDLNISLIHFAAANDIAIIIFSNSVVVNRNKYELKQVPGVLLIYLFANVLYHGPLVSNQRFRGTFNNIHILFEQIRHDINDLKGISRPVTAKIQYVMDNSATFFWYRFFFNVLSHLQHTNIAKHEMIAQFRAYCRAYSYTNDDINEFERDYRADNAVWWYTRESFFHQQLNETLRSNDINNIFLWRTYIQDFDKALQKLSVEQDDTKPLCLFRVQLLHIHDIDKHKKNIGKLITVTSFLSTTVDQSIAEFYFQTYFRPHSKIQSVFYRIFIDSRCKKIRGAQIKDLSMFIEEDEYIFSLRSLFRIDRVEYINKRWNIDLTAVDEDDQEFCTIINPWKATIGEQSFFSNCHEKIFTRYLDNKNGPFLAFQLLIDLILRLHQTEFARQEMIEMFQYKYADSPNDLKKIDEFNKTFRKENAIKWYTSDSFLYRILHETLRLEDIDTIFKLRYFIHDLHNLLVELQTPFIQSLHKDQRILTLYRGQRMKMNELKKLQENVGKLISMNSFLSTTNNVQAAVFFAGDGLLEDPTSEVSVIYQITIDLCVAHSIPFSKIDYQSIYEDEEEVLFSMASVFQIDTIEQYGSLWIVDLILINKVDEGWKQLTAHLNSFSCNRNFFN